MLAQLHRLTINTEATETIQKTIRAGCRWRLRVAGIAVVECWHLLLACMAGARQPATLIIDVYIASEIRVIWNSLCQGKRLMSSSCLRLLTTQTRPKRSQRLQLCSPLDHRIDNLTDWVVKLYRITG